MFTPIHKSISQDFENFKRIYILKNYGDDSIKIKHTVVLKKTLTTEMVLEGSLPKVISNYDSIIQIEILPLYYRRETFTNKNADCICQENGVDFIRNQLTNYENQKLNDFRNTKRKSQLDILFFDPIIGWEGVSEQKPVVKDTIIDNKLFIKVEVISRNSRRYVHFVDKDHYNLLKTIIIDSNGNINQEITRRNFKKYNKTIYPSEIIIDTHIHNYSIRITEYIYSINFYKNTNNEGIFNCQLPYKDIILK